MITVDWFLNLQLCLYSQKSSLFLKNIYEQSDSIVIGRSKKYIPNISESQKWSEEQRPLRQNCGSTSGILFFWCNKDCTTVVLILWHIIPWYLKLNQYPYTKPPFYNISTTSGIPGFREVFFMFSMNKTLHFYYKMFYVRNDGTM
jgi:hypothetical protein